MLVHKEVNVSNFVTQRHYFASKFGVCTAVTYSSILKQSTDKR